MQWILKSWKREFFWLYLPGPLTFVLGYFLSARFEASTIFFIYALLVRDFMDSGHIYATLWRTYLDPEERVRSKMYWLVPIIFMLLFFVWIYYRLPFLAAFVAYVTIFHNCRQFYGISKWYQRINNSYRKSSDFFLYANCFLPIVVAHFRTNYNSTTYYIKDTLFLHPDQNICNAFTLLYFAVLLCWFAYEIQLFVKKQFELNRVLSVALPSFIYGFAFMLGRSVAEILPALVISHGMGYFAMTSLAINKKNPRRFHSFYVSLATILLTAVFFGNILGALKEYFLAGTSHVAMALILAAYITPFFCHYLFDAFIWKSKHPDSKIIYSDQPLIS